MWFFVTVGTRRMFRPMAYQICLNNGKWLIDSFTDAISKPYGYLVLNHHSSTPEDQTVVTNILPGAQLTYYINKKRQSKAALTFSDE